MKRGVSIIVSIGIAFLLAASPAFADLSTLDPSLIDNTGTFTFSSSDGVWTSANWSDTTPVPYSWQQEGWGIAEGSWPSTWSPYDDGDPNTYLIYKEATMIVPNSTLSFYDDEGALHTFDRMNGSVYTFVVVGFSGRIPYVYDSEVFASGIMTINGNSFMFERTGEITSFTENTMSGDFSATLQPVPVPAALWLFGSGFVGLIGIRRKIRG